jgi:hypothetical protein
MISKVFRAFDVENVARKLAPTRYLDKGSEYVDEE